MRYLIAVLALFAPLPALALSCLAPLVERSFAQYDAAKEEYVVVYGRVTLNMSDLPKGMTTDETPPEMTHVEAKLRGSSLSANGFALPFDRALTLEVGCIGPWCGSVQNGAEVLAFVRKDPKGYALPVSPCGGAVFYAPKPAMLRRVKQCLVQKNCTAD